MDIYSYICSPEVAEHCRKIGKTWNTLEMAVIIDRSNRTIADKHAAWQELIEHYSDMPAIPNYHDIQFDSTHEILAEKIAHERQLVELFKAPADGAVYTYGPHTWGSRFYTTFEKALTNLKEKWLDKTNLDPYFVKQISTELTYGRSQSGVPYFRFSKTFPGADKYELDAVSDRDGNLYDIWGWADDGYRDEHLPGVIFRISDGMDLASNFFIDIPIPFKRGDILTCAGRAKPDVFILDSAYVIDTPELLEKSVQGKIGDGSDMSGNGLLVNELGILYWDHAGDYDTFVSHKGELEKKDRLLYYVNLYMANKIPLHVLLYMQCRIMTEQTLSGNFKLSSHDCYIPEHLIYENRKK